MVRIVGRRSSFRLVVVLGAAGVVLTGGSPAGAAAAPGNLYVKAAVGLPAKDRPGANAAGTVDVYMNGGTRQVLNEQTLGLAGQAGGGEAYFGKSLAITDLDADGYSDLVIGAPGRPLTFDVGTHVAHVDIVFGTSTGIGTVRAATLTSPGATGDRFGWSVALTGRGTDLAPRDLWVGAPGTTVDGKVDAGAVYRYALGSTGQPTLVEKITQDSPLVGGAAEAGDRFGTVLGATLDGVIIGIPDEDIGTAVNAGIIQVLRLDTAGNRIRSQDWSQNTKGVPGTPEAFDRFGAAIGEYGYGIGVPGEDVGKVTDAGAVQLFSVGDEVADPTTPLIPKALLTQDSRGIPGTAEKGDRFGTSVIGSSVCRDLSTLAIGSPGEDVGRVKDAGSVTTVLSPIENQSYTKSCPAKALSQGHGLPGASEAGDRLGAALGGSSRDPSPADPEGAGGGDVAIGVPGEDVGTTPDTGRVVLGGKAYGYSGGDQEDLAYGSVFAAPLFG